MTPSFYAPAFRVTVDGSNLAADVSKYITQVSVTNESNSLDSFNLVLVNPYPDMRWTHTKDADLFKVGAGVKIELGYVDNLQLMMDGEITSLSPNFPDSGTPTLGVGGNTRLHRLQRTCKLRTFKDATTDKEMAEKIIQDANLTPQVDDTQTKFPYMVNDAQTDLDFLMKRGRAIGFELLAEGKTIVFRKAQKKQGSLYTLEYGKSLRSFQPTLDPRSQVNGVTYRGFDQANKKDIVAHAGQGDEDDTQGGAQTGPQFAASVFGPREDLQVTTPVASQQEGEQRARADYNDRIGKTLTGSGLTVGIPDLRPGMEVEIKGVGTLFSGRYKLTQTTHSIGSGGYQTSFRAEKGSVG